jgi:preprotein translocase subunit SecG
MDGKHASIFRVAALVLLVTIALLGAAVVGLASAASVTSIKIGDTFDWAESVYNALSRCTAAFYILYFILSVGLMILSWTASVGQPKPRSKVSSLLSSPSKIQAHES